MPKQCNNSVEEIEISGNTFDIHLFRFGKQFHSGKTRVNTDEFAAFLSVLQQARCSHQIPAQFDFVLPTDRRNFITFVIGTDSIRNRNKVTQLARSNPACTELQCKKHATRITVYLSKTEFVEPKPINCNAGRPCPEEYHPHCPVVKHRVALPHFPALIHRLHQQYLASLQSPPSPLPCRNHTTDPYDVYYEDGHFEHESDTRESVPDYDCYQNCFD